MMTGSPLSIHTINKMLANLDPKNILLVLHGSIGDVTRALPLANLIDRGFPNARLTWSVEPASAPLLQHHPAVDEVILFDRARWWQQLVSYLRRIRAGRFDLVLDLQRHLKSGIISRWCGAPHRLGFHRLDSKEFNWIFNNRRLPTLGKDFSKLNHYLKFAEYLGIVPEPVEWKLFLTEAEEVAVGRHLEKISGGFATLFVGSRWQSKNWFSWQITSCAELIQQRHGLSVVLLGSKSPCTKPSSCKRRTSIASCFKPLRFSKSVSWVAPEYCSFSRRGKDWPSTPSVKTKAFRSNPYSLLSPAANVNGTLKFSFLRTAAWYMDRTAFE